MALRSSVILVRVIWLWVTLLWLFRIRVLVAATLRRLAKVSLAAAPPVRTKATRTIDLLLRGELRLPPFFFEAGRNGVGETAIGCYTGVLPRVLPKPATFIRELG